MGRMSVPETLYTAAVAYLGRMATGPDFAFRVRFEPGARGEPVTGRMFVIASPISGPEPRFQVLTGSVVVVSASRAATWPAARSSTWM